MPIARPPRSRAIWPTIEPTGPAADETSTVSPALNCATSFMPNQAVIPGMPRMPSASEGGWCSGCSFQAPAPSVTA